MGANNKTKSLKLNFLMNAILSMSAFIFPLITFPYVSRVLGPAGTGKVSFGTSLISYFTMFAQLGIPTYGIRVCAQVRDNKEELSRTVHELLGINILMSIISYVVLGVCLISVPRLQSERILYIVLSCQILLKAVGVEWLYQALEQYTYIAVRSIIFKFIALVAMFFLVKAENDYIIYGGISIFAASASSVCNFINLHRLITFRPVGGYHFKRHLQPIAIFFAMSCATTIYLHLDTVMLGFMTTDVEVGYYNAAVKIKTVLVSIVTSLGHVLLPRASYYVQKKEMDKFYAVTKKALNFVFLFATPLTIFFILFAREGILFLSGRAFLPSTTAMQVIMPTLLLIGITNILGIQILVPTGREKIVLYSEIGGAITDIILNAIFIPLFGAAGASLGTLVAEFVVLIIQFHYLKNEMLESFKSIHYGKIILAVALGSACMIPIKYLISSTFASLVIGVVIFFGLYYMIMMLTKEEFVFNTSKDIAIKVKKKIIHKS